MVTSQGEGGANPCTSTPPEDPALFPSLSESGEIPALGPRGDRLWSSLRASVVGEQGLVLLEEACRTADRLDKLDALLRGDADVWCRLTHDLRTESYELRIDSALIEARQQANTLRQLIAGLVLKESDDDADDPDAWVADVSS